MIETHTDNRGHLSVIEDCPFPIERIFWIYGVPLNISRAGHKHETCEQLLICQQGMISVILDDKEHILLENDYVYVLAGTMIILEYFTNNAILLALASEKYDPAKVIEC